jgi:chromosome segregation ATPase
MSRDSDVTFDHVRQACYEILSRGERPSRPSVQELLASDRYIGRKGSNDLVQKFVNDFWKSMARTLQVTPRTVEGVPEAFVPIIDKALGEMVAVSRQLATDELADREAMLNKRAMAMEEALQEARDAAFGADQLRVRAEGELSSMQIRAGEIKDSLTEVERKLADETRKVELHQRTIDEKDAEIRRQFISLETANRSMEQANEHHRLESHRLMQQVDDERQAIRKEAQHFAEQLEKSRGETAAVREESAALREAIAGLKAENAAAVANMTSLTTSLKEAMARLELAASKLQAAQQEATMMRVRYETAEQHRQDVVARSTSQAEEVGELRRVTGQLKQELAFLRGDFTVQAGEE